MNPRAKEAEAPRCCGACSPGSLTGAPVPCCLGPQDTGNNVQACRGDTAAVTGQRGRRGGLSEDSGRCSPGPAQTSLHRAAQGRRHRSLNAL